MELSISAKNKVVLEYWRKYYAAPFCTLCGNSGIIDTKGVKTANDNDVGRENYCICPNGQELRSILEEVPPEITIIKELISKGFFLRLDEMIEEKGCDSESLHLAKEILTDMGYSDDEITNLLEFFELYGGYCDCEILINGLPRFIYYIEKVAE